MYMHTYSPTHSPSLSLSHTHTHTHTPALGTLILSSVSTGVPTNLISWLSGEAMAPSASGTSDKTSSPSPSSRPTLQMVCFSLLPPFSLSPLLSSSPPSPFFSCSLSLSLPLPSLSSLFFLSLPPPPPPPPPSLLPPSSLLCVCVSLFCSLFHSIYNVHTPTKLHTSLCVGDRLHDKVGVHARVCSAECALLRLS